MKTHRWLTTMVILLAAAGAAACSDDNGPNAGFSNVAVSFSTEAPASAQPTIAPSFSAVPITDGSGNVIDLTSVEIVLREVELERVEITDCDDVISGSDDDCDKFEVGPILLDLPLGTGPAQEFAIDVEPGIYDEIEFDVHKPDDEDPEDLAFIQANPEFADISIRATGTYNGDPFTYTSDLNEEQELALVPNLVIEESQARSTNITVFVDVDAWFRDTDGTLVDPDSANKGEVNEGLVKDNIKQAFEAFEDEDRNGEDDSEETT